MECTIEAFLVNHVDSLKAEQTSSRKKVTIIGVNCGKTVFGGARQMQRVRCSKKCGDGNISKFEFQSFLNRLG